MAIKPVEILIKARDEASGIFGTLQGKVVGLGVAIAGYFGINAFIGAVKGASDLEAKLSEVKAVSGATADEMVKLRKAAEDAGASTKYTATEAADALGNLSRAGLSAKDSIAALPAVLQLAQAGDIGLAEASSYVTKTVMGLGLAFTDAGRVADVLAMGANASNTSVTGLAQALSYAAPLANSLGLSLESTVAIIGKFADAGIDASRAGTALNAIMAQFADPASKFRTELAAAGITTGNFEQALRQLAAAGPAGSKAILAVGTEAGPALRALLNQGIGALDDLKGKLDNAAGSAAKTAAVMQDNLKGSFNSLSSAWDTVKNTLATPVLPVLKDGITQVADAFRGAVADGTIGKFGSAIATAFEGGLKWAREFLGGVDFAALSARMQAFATSTQDTFTKIGEYATNAGNIVKLVYGVMSAGTNAVLTVVYGLGVAFAGVAAGIQNGLALLYEGMAKITFGAISEKYKQVAADIRQSAEATTAASRALADKTIESFNDMGDAAQTARNGWAGLTNGASAAGTQAAASTQVFKTVAETLKEVGGDATATGQKAQAAGILQKQAADTTRAAVAQLKTEYEAAVGAGNWQLAAEKIKELAKATDGAKTGIADLKKKAEEDARAVADAFAGLGITSQASLNTAAASAREMFNTIKGDAKSTTADTANAFKVYAEKAIAANNGVATEALKVKAAMEGVSIQTDGAGKAIVKAMAEGAAAVKTVEDAYRQLGLKTPKELENIAKANEAAWVKIKNDSNASVDTLKVAFSTYAQSAIAASGNIGSAQRLTTEETLKTEAAVKGLTITFDANGKLVVQTQAEAAAAIQKTTGALGGQRDAIDSVTSALERQNAAQERANAAIEKAAELERKRQNVDKEGYMLNTAGERISISKPSERSVYENAKGQGLTEAQALQISNQFIQNGQQTGYGGANTAAGENWGTELQKAIDKLVLANAAKNALTGTPGSPTTTVNVRITLPNGSTQIVPTTQDGSAALIAALQSAKLSAGF